MKHSKKIHPDTLYRMYKLVEYVSRLSGDMDDQIASLVIEAREIMKDDSMCYMNCHVERLIKNIMRGLSPTTEYISDRKAMSILVNEYKESDDQSDDQEEHSY